jgi:hypothetical protein
MLGRTWRPAGQAGRGPDFFIIVRIALPLNISRVTLNHSTAKNDACGEGPCISKVIPTARQITEVRGNGIPINCYFSNNTQKTKILV